MKISTNHYFITEENHFSKPFLSEDRKPPDENKDDALENLPNDLEPLLSINNPSSTTAKNQTTLKWFRNSLFLYISLRYLALRWKRWLSALGKSLLDFSRNYANWVSLFQVTLEDPINTLPRSILKTAQLVPPVTMIINGLIILNALRTSKENPSIRRMRLVSGVASLSLGIVSLSIPVIGLIMSTTSVAINAAMNLGILGTALANRTWGKWHKERQELNQNEEEFYQSLSNPDTFQRFKNFKNKSNSNSLKDEESLKLDVLEHRILEGTNRNRELNADLVSKTHNIVHGLIVLTGLVLCFFPPTIVVGSALLLGASIYGLSYNYDWPKKWATRLHDFFFAPKKLDSIEEIEKKVALYKKNHPAPSANTLSTEAVVTSALLAEQNQEESKDQKTITIETNQSQPLPLVSSSIPVQNTATPRFFSFPASIIPDNQTSSSSTAEKKSCEFKPD